MMVERGVAVDHTIIWRWIQRPFVWTADPHRRGKTRAPNVRFDPLAEKTAMPDYITIDTNFIITSVSAEIRE
jgi:hypothetical protein